MVSNRKISKRALGIFFFVSEKINLNNICIPSTNLYSVEYIERMGIIYRTGQENILFFTKMA